MNLLLGVLGCPGTPTVVEPPPTPVDCADVLDTPVLSTSTGFSGGEGLAIDGSAVVSVDASGRLTRQTADGSVTVVRAGLGVTAGLALLPDGDVVLADVEAGTLLRIGPDGATSVLASGLQYPNGVAVDERGRVIVSELSLGDVLRIDPVSGTRETIGTGLDGPNGVAVVDGGVLVVSFGEGTVTRLTESDEGWAAEVFGDVAIQVPSTPCAADGDACMIGAALGVCSDGACTPVRDEASCAGLDDGTPCQTTVLGQTVDALCTGEPTFCPYTPTDLSCDQEWAACEVNGEVGTCELSPQGVLGCRVLRPSTSCDGLSEGAPCAENDGVFPTLGTCEPLGELLTCRPPDLDPIGGGLDGLTVDACGNVYATEFRTGAVHRWGADGGRSEVYAELPSPWIPNFAWGSGEGGFAADALYVMDRQEGRLFEVRVGVPGR